MQTDKLSALQSMLTLVELNIYLRTGETND